MKSDDPKLTVGNNFFNEDTPRVVFNEPPAVEVAAEAATPADVEVTADTAIPVATEIPVDIKRPLDIKKPVNIESEVASPAENDDAPVFSSEFTLNKSSQTRPQLLITPSSDSIKKHIMVVSACVLILFFTMLTRGLHYFDSPWRLAEDRSLVLGQENKAWTDVESDIDSIIDRLEKSK